MDYRQYRVVGNGTMICMENDGLQNLSEAKKVLIDIYKERYENKLKIVKIADDWYALEFC